MTGLSDFFQRPINYLRIAVTDRCNLRCIYCMPSSGICLLPRDNVLSYEEIITVARVAVGMGITKIRLTGGEPLVRPGVTALVANLTKIAGIEEVSLTTNGVLLAQYAAELKAAGLRRVNVSLDTLKKDRFRQIARQGELKDVLEGIEAARQAGLNPVKINMVVMRGINDDEILDFARKTLTDGWHVRFIELMPFGETDMPPSCFIPIAEIQQKLSALGEMKPFYPPAGNGPARYFQISQNGKVSRGSIGFISPVSEHFCFSCNRLRLTADGKLRPCLLSEGEVDLKTALRQENPEPKLKTLIQEAVAAKPQQHNLGNGMCPHDRPMAQVGG